MTVPKKGKPDKAAMAAADRVRWYLDHLFAGNRAAMAKAADVAASVIVRIASGERMPGRRLLEAIAEVPRVNPAWLMTGQGEPIVAEGKGPGAGGWELPVVSQLLPGDPDKHQAMLTGETFPVAGTHYRDTRYLYAVRNADLVAQYSGELITGRDLLLIETDRKWGANYPSLDGRLAVVRRGDQAAGELWLARIAVIGANREGDPYREGDTETVEADFFDTEPEAPKRPPVQRFEVITREGEEPQIKRLTRRQGRPMMWRPEIDRNWIVGMVVQLIRRDP